MTAARNLRLVVDSEAVGTKRTPKAPAADAARQREAEIDKMRAARARERDKARVKLARAGRWTPELAVPLTLPAEADVRAWVLRLPAGVRQVLVRVAASLYVPRHALRPLPEVLRKETDSRRAAERFGLTIDAIARGDLAAAEREASAAASHALGALMPAIDRAREEGPWRALTARLLERARHEPRTDARESLREVLLLEALRAVGFTRDQAHAAMRARLRKPRAIAARDGHRRRRP